MKKLIIVAIVIFTVISNSYAQIERKHQAQKPVKPHAFKQGKPALGHMLKMTEEQRKQAQTIRTEFEQKLTKLNSNDKLTLGDYKKQLASLEKERKNKLQGLLTTEQKEKIATAKQKAAENKQVRNAAMLERMKLKLNLQEEQVAKIKAMNEELKQKATTIKNNDNLSSMDKKIKMKELFAERKNTMQTILTTEQQNKMAEMKQRPHHSKK